MISLRSDNVNPSVCVSVTKLPSSAQAQAQLEAELAFFSFDPATHPIYVVARDNICGCAKQYMWLRKTRESLQPNHFEPKLSQMAIIILNKPAS